MSSFELVETLMNTDGMVARIIHTSWRIGGAKFCLLPLQNLALVS